VSATHRDTVQERLDAAEAVAEAMGMALQELQRSPPDEGKKQDALMLLAHNLDYFMARSSQGWCR